MAPVQIPFYAVAGNHDWRGNVSAQIAYSGVSERWNYPDYNYNFKESFAGDDGAVYELEVIMIDTIILAGLSGDDPSDPAPGVLQDDLTFTTEARRDDTLSWLEQVVVYCALLLVQSSPIFLPPPDKNSGGGQTSYLPGFDGHERP